MKDLEDDIGKPKAAKIAPIALGGKDRWPDAFYYDIFALRLCDKDIMKTQLAAGKLTDKCFTDAGQATLDFLKSAPFQDGFNGTSAQQGPGSSAGMVANGKAAMELQGTWDMGVMGGLTDDKSLSDKIGWFPFPAVDGGKGDPSAALGGGDGFSCTTNAHMDICADFLHFLDSKDIQESMLKANSITIPVVAAASEGDQPAGAAGRRRLQRQGRLCPDLLRPRAADRARPGAGRRSGGYVWRPGWPHRRR